MDCPSCHENTLFKNERSQNLICLSCQSSFLTPLAIKKKILRVGIIIGLILIAPFVIHLSSQILLRVITQKSNNSADTIVILGRGEKQRRARAIAASKLWANNPSAKIFVSGMSDAPEIIKMLQEMGVARTALSGERCSQTTWENGSFSALLLEANQIILITDSPHMLRAVLVFKGFGFDVEPHPVESESENILTVNGYQSIARESAALLTYGISGKFKPESPNQKQQSDTQATDKLKKWGCQLPKRKAK